MKTKVALLVIYNHRFDKNIEIIEKLYSSRFSFVFHIIPFYDGNKENVIPVFENSLYFEGYIAQAYTHIKYQHFTHFFILADDMVLNPKIDENNLWTEIGIDYDDCMLQDLRSINGWNIIDKMAVDYKVKPYIVEIENLIPSRNEAISIFKKKNLPLEEVYIENPKLSFIRKIYNFIRGIKPKNPYHKLDYPMVGGYSDIFIVTADVMPKLCTLLGCFAATNLFVEIAIPTAMNLVTDKIKYDKDLKLKYGAMWTKTEKDFYPNKYNYILSDLIDNFPIDKLYLHPIKLSKWKI